MEPNRYFHNKWLFNLCMIFLVVGLSLLVFSIYIAPPLCLNWNYNIPEFTFFWREEFRIHYNLTERMAGFVTFLTWFIPALIILFVAYLFGNQIENEIQGITPVKDDLILNDLRETSSVSFQLIMIIVAVLIGVFLVEWLVFGSI